MSAAARVLRMPHGFHRRGECCRACVLASGSLCCRLKLLDEFCGVGRHLILERHRVVDVLDIWGRSVIPFFFRLNVPGPGNR